VRSEGPSVAILLCLNNDKLSSGGYGYDFWNTEGKMFLKFADAMNLVVVKTLFKKADRQ